MLALFGAGAVLWGGWAGWTGWRYRTAMAEIRSEVATGRYGIAAHKLVKVLAWKPDSDEAAYLLGSCEQARGRNQAAGEAWARVVPGAAFWDRAIMSRLRLFHESGRLADAEQLIRDAAEDPRNERSALLVLLVPLYNQEGRLDEGIRLIEARWEHLNEKGEGALEPAIKLVRMHIELTGKAIPVENLRAYFEQVVGLAPLDDRVWLGQANLAIRTGAYVAADRLLDACLKRRPHDVPVWRARLNWAIATDRIDVVQDALTHLPAAESNPAQLRRLRAWLACKRREAPPNAGSWNACSRPIRPIGTPWTGWPNWPPTTGSRHEPPSSSARRRKSSGSRRATRNFTTGDNPFATRWRWPTWRSSSAACSRPERPSRWRSRKTPTARMWGATWNG